MPDKETKGISRTKLFERILIIAAVSGIIIVVSLLFNPNKIEFLNNLYFELVILISFLVYKYGNKNLAYHLLPFGLSLLYLYSAYFLDNKNFIIILIYPTFLVYYFIFFREKRILLLALSYIIVNQFLLATIIVKNLQLELEDTFLMTMFVNVVATNIAIFLMCYFYLRQIREIQIDSELANKELVKNEAYVKIQKDELERKNNELRSYIESNLQLENFAHLASHELKTPVRNIMNFSHLLERSIDSKINNNEREYLGYISDNTYKMHELITDLHRLSSVSRSKIEKNEINVPNLFDEIVDDLKMTIEKKGGVINYDGNIKTIWGQENLIKQVFSNLLFNALKFTKSDTKPKIDIISNQDDYHHYFHISDNGIGIDPKYKDKIFLIFKRLHSENTFKGTGIGLAICKKVMDLHDGDITVNPNPQGGSIFLIKLPKKSINN